MVLVTAAHAAKWRAQADVAVLRRGVWLAGFRSGCRVFLFVVGPWDLLAVSQDVVCPLRGEKGLMGGV